MRNEDKLRINLIPGYGIFAQRDFEKGDFLLNYVGQLLSNSEALEREKKHGRAGEGCFMFFFTFDGKRMW